MAIVFDENGKYVDEKGFVKLDPTQFADWQIAEEAEKTLPSVDYFREKLGLLPEEIIPYGKTPKIDFIKVMKRLADKPDGKFIEVTAVTPTPFGEGKSTVSLGLIEGLRAEEEDIGKALAIICRHNGITMDQLKEQYDAALEQAVINSVLTGKVMSLIRENADIAE